MVCSADGWSLSLDRSCDAEANEVCTIEEGAVCRDGCEVAATFRSSVGCEFYAVDLDNYAGDEGNAAAQQYAIVLTNPGRSRAEVTVEINHALPGETPDPEVIRSFIVDPGVLYSIDDLDAREVDGSPPGTFDSGTHTALTSNAFRIRSTAPLFAAQFNPFQRFDVFSNDASLLLPTSFAGFVGSGDPRGEPYVVMGWPQLLAQTEDPDTNAGIDLRATLTIVGTAADTTVTVRTSADILGSPDVPATQAGGQFSLVLGPFDVLNLETDGFGADFSGTEISSSRPVMVFSGNECTDVPAYDSRFNRHCCCDHLEEQLLPVTLMGNTFVAVQTPSRTQALADAGATITPLPSEKEYWRFLSDVSTDCSTTLPPPLDELSLSKGVPRTIEAHESFVVRCNAATIAAQFVASAAVAVGPGMDDLPAGDPSFILLPSVELYRREHLFLVPDKYAFDFLLIAAPSEANVWLDDVAIEQYANCERDFIGTVRRDNRDLDYDEIRCALSQPIITPGLPRPDNLDPGVQNDGTHSIRADAPVGLVVYGFDYNVSYGYSGGAWAPMPIYE